MHFSQPTLSLRNDLLKMAKKQYSYQTIGGVCPSHIFIETDDTIISHVEVTFGCPGNLQGIAQLLKGMKIADAIQRLEGIKCGKKQTSCPDQIAQALRQIQDNG